MRISEIWYDMSGDSQLDSQILTENLHTDLESAQELRESTSSMFCNLNYLL